jgi:hypothetical protein
MSSGNSLCFKTLPLFALFGPTPEIGRPLGGWSAGGQERDVEATVGTQSDAPADGAYLGSPRASQGNATAAGSSRAIAGTANLMLAGWMLPLPGW